ncbi:heme-binding domain-containing protein [Mucilaginibacter sp. SMC90]|uniref:heme-binding domain-containing protein n=1 Tax=Mucilaginibacter TaxID=423349 RepID=UPI00131D8D1E|nr:MULTISPECIES: heme-binding domain-containing protein [unclassified Mucilaginibacter]MBS7565673.1 heme-binding domain-containing protein [Mucilaginibacter sp. Bleaf8]UOE49865.1 heme-binding domain-containing protein [Mucilaginibacter sp. SMC90]
MKRPLKISFIALLALFIIIQFIPRGHNEGIARGGNDISKATIFPADVNVILQGSCYDCHSNHTEYPWYSKIQPVRYILDDHIRNGKKELNFTEFAGYTKRRQRSRLREIGQSLSEGSMPLSSYILIHRNAILSQKEKQRLQQWAKTTGDSLSLKN